MNIRRLICLCVAAVLLPACDGGAPQSQTVSPGITVPPVATNAPATTVQPTAAVATSIPSVEPSAMPAPSAEPTTPPVSTNSPAQPTSAPAVGLNDELLFLRQSTLIAFDLGTRTERTLATNVTEFLPTPDARTIALIRNLGKNATPGGIDIWLVGRDGSGLRQITSDGDTLVEATPTWAPDGTALAYAASASSAPYAHSWLEWSAWCAASQVYVRTLADQTAQKFGPGCDPAISPDGKRIAYATPPSMRQDSAATPNAANAIRLINRQGQNGWDFATASAAPNAQPDKQGLLVYAPSWSPDGTQLSYQRFIGYRALVDLAMTEISGSFAGKGQPLNDGAGWLLPAQFAPTGGSVAIVENNFSDARGFGGYDNWSVSVLQLGGTHEIALPDGPITAQGQVVGRLARAQAAAWAPGGDDLAVLLPPGWKPDLPSAQPFGTEGAAGEVWRWRPSQGPRERIVAQVDFASPLAWLPGQSGGSAP